MFRSGHSFLKLEIIASLAEEIQSKIGEKKIGVG